MVFQQGAIAPVRTVEVVNRTGRGPVVLVCDHASNHIPASYNGLGLDPAEMTRHIAWDPGAMPVSASMSAALDAPLIAAAVSRLVADCNRPLDAPDLVAELSETTVIPGNRDLSPEALSERIALAHEPFHAAIEAMIDERIAAGLETWLVSVHSFTPIYRGVPRPWQIGIVHDDDERLSRSLLEGLKRQGLTVGDNQPYSPADRVYYTLERHARSRGLPCAMIEIRNDEIAGEDGQRQWAERLAGILRETMKAGLSGQVAA